MANPTGGSSNPFEEGYTAPNPVGSNSTNPFDELLQQEQQPGPAMPRRSAPPVPTAVQNTSTNASASTTASTNPMAAKTSDPVDKSDIDFRSTRLAFELNSQQQDGMSQEERIRQDTLGAKAARQLAQVEADEELARKLQSEEAGLTVAEQIAIEESDAELAARLQRELNTRQSFDGSGDANYALTLQDEELARRMAEDEQRAAHQAVWMEERDRQMAVHLQSAEQRIAAQPPPTGVPPHAVAFPAPTYPPPSSSFDTAPHPQYPPPTSACPQQAPASPNLQAGSTSPNPGSEPASPRKRDKLKDLLKKPMAKMGKGSGNNSNNSSYTSLNGDQDDPNRPPAAH